MKNRAHPARKPNDACPLPLEQPRDSPGEVVSDPAYDLAVQSCFERESTALAYVGQRSRPVAILVRSNYVRAIIIII